VSPTTDAPAVPLPLGSAIHGLFALLSRLRGARSLHPKGVAYAGVLTIEGLGEPTGSGFLDRPATYDALVRCSRGGGLPEPLPDVLGIALRAVDADGPGRPRDLLLASSAAPPVARHLLVPGVRFGRRICSSILPYRVPGGLLLLGAAMRDGASVAAMRAGAAPMAIDLLAASPTGPWRRVGTLTPQRRLRDAESAALGFDPWHAGPDLQPAGFLNALRRPAYAGSRSGRPRTSAAGEHS
jgi:hypothetical protein